MEDYIIDKEGKRAMSDEYIRKQEEQYLGSKGLFPIKLGEQTKEVIAKKLLKSINWGEPVIIIHKKDLSKEVFAIILSLILRKFKTYISYDITTVNYLLNGLIDNGYDISSEFDSSKILFVRMNLVEVPHMYNAYCTRNIANYRKGQNKLTFFFFKGELKDLTEADKWKIDEEGLGQKGVITFTDFKEKDSSDRLKTIDKRKLTPLTNYIDYVDLNKTIS